MWAEAAGLETIRRSEILVRDISTKLRLRDRLVALLGLVVATDVWANSASECHSEGAQRTGEHSKRNKSCAALIEKIRPNEIHSSACAMR